MSARFSLLRLPGFNLVKVRNLFTYLRARGSVGRVRVGGQSMLYAVLLLPTLMLVFGMAIDVGMLQMQQLRLRWAVDMATVDAATLVDAASYSRTGRIQLDPALAPAVARQYLYLNLARLGSSVGGGLGASAIARTADIAVVNQVPAHDPFSGAWLDRPAISIRIRAPYRMSVLPWLAYLGANQLTITSNAEVKR